MAEYEHQEKVLYDQNVTGPGKTFGYYNAQFWFRASRKKSEGTYLRRQSEIRKAMIEIASRAYKLDKGSGPQKIADLVPDYLTAIPINPSTGRAMTLPP